MKHQLHLEWWKVIADDWFSPNITSKIFLHMILGDCSVNFIA